MVKKLMALQYELEKMRPMLNQVMQGMDFCERGGSMIFPMYDGSSDDPTGHICYLQYPQSDGKVNFYGFDILASPLSLVVKEAAFKFREALICTS